MHPGQRDRWSPAGGCGSSGVGSLALAERRRRGSRRRRLARRSRTAPRGRRDLAAAARPPRRPRRSRRGHVRQRHGSDNWLDARERLQRRRRAARWRSSARRRCSPCSPPASRSRPRSAGACSRDRRRIGLLRAVGVTPRGVTGAARRALPGGRRAGRSRSGCSPAGCSPRRLLGEHGDAARRRPQPGAPGPALIAEVAALALLAVVASRPRCPRGAPAGSRRWSRSSPCARRGATARRAPPRIAQRAARCPSVAVLGAKDAYVQRARALLTMASLALAAMVVVCALALRGDDGPHRLGLGAARPAVGSRRRQRRRYRRTRSDRVLASIARRGGGRRARYDVLTHQRR